jgi:hypothetical protein
VTDEVAFGRLLHQHAQVHLQRRLVGEREINVQITQDQVVGKSPGFENPIVRCQSEGLRIVFGFVRIDGALPAVQDIAQDHLV